MDKSQKIEYQQQIEKYLEEHQVYDLFEHLMKILLKEKPKEPLDFLISKLENPERKIKFLSNIAKRIFVMGPPGCRKKEKGLTLAGDVNYEGVSVGDLLDNEVGKKTEQGKKIAEAKSKNAFGKILNNSLVDDEIVIDLVNKQIREFEKKGKSYIIVGYPRTRVQAINLQRMGITPDKFFILNLNEAAVFQKIRGMLQVAVPESEGKPRKSFTEEQLDLMARNAILEYNMLEINCKFIGISRM